MRSIPEKDLFAKRPIPFYYITTHDPKELTYEKFLDDLSDMKAKGYGGIVLFNRPPSGFNRELYFTEAWFEMVGNCVRASHDVGLRVWLNDDYDAPPGDIGGRLEKIAPHLKPQRLRLNNGVVSVEEVPWGFPAFEHPESPIFFQNYVYEEYKRRFGEYFGNTIVGFFSDADSRRVNSDVYNTNSPMVDYFPWTDGFQQSFQNAYHYDITPHLPSIIRREPSQQSRDYWEHNGTLYMNWFASNYKWCRENGLEYTFHTSDTAPYPVSTTYFNSVFAEGKAIDAGQHCDWPGTDHETLNLNGAPWVRRDLKEHLFSVYGTDCPIYTSNFYDTYADLRAKQAQSSAYLYDKDGVMCEMYAGVSWYATYKDLRNIATWQFMQGVNFVVYQAYHYRLWGSTKHFAPLAFSPHSHTDFTIKQFNDYIARTAYVCSQGKLKVDVALLDATDAIWAGTGDSKKELELVKKFHHLPNGFIISDIKGIRRKAHQLKAVVNPGLPLTQIERDEIRDLGLLIFEYEDSDKIASEIPCGIRWNGNGELMFMRRILDDGNELLIVANVESDQTLSGTLTFNNTDYVIELASGEMAFFGCGFDSYRAPQNDSKKLLLQSTVPVTYHSPNLLPLVRWEDRTGRAVTLRRPENNVPYIIQQGWIPPQLDTINEIPTLNPVFRFTSDVDLTGLNLLIPDDIMPQIINISINGNTVVPTQVSIFDDPYTCYSFDITAGKQEIALALNSLISTPNLIYICGEFDATINTSGGYLYAKGASYMTEFADISISKRSTSLETGLSWTEQGQPLYTGTIDYCFDIDIDESISQPTLVIPDMRDPVKVYIDDTLIASVPFAPYRIALGVKGKHRLRLSVCNTLGGMFNCFKIASGLLSVPYITSG